MMAAVHILRHMALLLFALVFFALERVGKGLQWNASSLPGLKVAKFVICQRLHPVHGLMSTVKIRIKFELGSFSVHRNLGLLLVVTYEFNLEPGCIKRNFRSKFVLLNSDQLLLLFGFL